jgi:hypothetical protein
VNLFPKKSAALTPADPSLSGMLAARDPWQLDSPLFDWARGDSFTLRHALEAVAIFGEIGAAKTTGSAAWIIRKYFELGMGGLVCCVKPGDRELIESYAKLTGRSDSLIIVSPKNRWHCNFLKYTLNCPGAIGSRVEQIVSLLMTIAEAAERAERSSAQGDKFWTQSLRELLRNAVEICVAARGEVTMTLLDGVINSAPRSPEEVHSEEWQRNSLCYQLIEEAEKRDLSFRQQADFELAARYFLRKIPDMPHDTRGSIFATYGVMADALRRGHMADLFDSDTTFVPELTFEGAIIVLDLPIKVYGQAGIYVQSALTYLWQLACEQRDVNKNPRPVFLFIDEAHELISNHTSEFLATARSARVASVLITQNKPNYLAAMGGEAGRHRVDACLANIGTKIFHANGDPETNKWASDMISEEVEIRMNYHGSRDGNGQGNGGGSESVGRKVLPSVFTQLKKGGPQNDFWTEAVIFRTGESFSSNKGEPWLRTKFKQLIPGVTMKDAKGGRSK